MFHGEPNVSWRTKCFMENQMFHGEPNVSWRTKCFMENQMFHGEPNVSWRTNGLVTTERVFSCTKGRFGYSIKEPGSSIISIQFYM